jgi:hypothetical protein
VHCHRWGILHTEKFWRENAKLLEGDNFKALKALIALLGSRDAVRAVSVMAAVLCGAFCAILCGNTENCPWSM